ncbi:hypothetical protein FYJ75_05440 [Roseburia sp. MUC/MUC-530-WT-4D]|uniref:Uncharacterized protein n=1 Tax=Roseburia porci TaxID=2605790 RepID=A0A6L5YRZ5_9FIRM|nr:hypothetical protein [Roseburia porci]MST74481.1 hypothetical protein [Roseburia porci]
MNRKKLIIIVVAVVLAVLIAGIGGYLYVDHEKTTKEVEKVEKLIDAIGYEDNGSGTEKVDTSEETETNGDTENVAVGVDTESDHGITLDSETAITEARAAYDKASEKVQKKVSNYDTLKKSEAQLETLKTEVQSVEDKIDKIGYDESLGNDTQNLVINGISNDSSTCIEDARNSYNSLQNFLQEAVENYDKLTKSEETLSRVETIKSVIDQINALGDITLDSETNINNTKSAYDSLSDEDKTFVSNSETLANAETSLNNLKQEAEAQRVAAEEAAKKEAEAQKSNSKSSNSGSKKGSSGSSSASNSSASASAPSNESSDSSAPAVSDSSSGTSDDSSSNTYNKWEDPNYYTYIDNNTPYDISALNRFIRPDAKIYCGSLNTFAAYKNRTAYYVNGVNPILYCFELSCQDDVNTAVQYMEAAGY